MISKRLNMIFSSKVFYIAFSLLVAFVLWMYVEINENKVQKLPVNSIQIIRQNEEILSDRGLFISAINPETVNLEFEGPRSVTSKLNNSNVTVVIDLAGITSRGSTTLRYDIVYPSNIDVESVNIVNRSVSSISLYIDRIESRSVYVDVAYRGGAAEGYILDPVEYTPQSIIVSGPIEIVSRVSSAHVSIIRENLTSTYSDDLSFVLLDEDGEEFDEPLRSQLTTSEETIHVNIPIIMKKEVALTVEFSYGSGATSQNTSYIVDPPTVIVAGNPDDVRDYNSLNLGTIDVTRFDYANTYGFTIVIPNNFTPISGETEASVFVEVLGLDIKHFSITNLFTQNEPSGYTVEIESQSVDVRIRGRAADMENLTEANIRVVADLTDASPGTQRVQAKVYVDGIDGDVGVVGTVNITVSIIPDT